MVTKTALLGLVLAGCSVSVVSQVRNDPTLNDAFRQAVPSVSLRELVKRSPESGLNNSCFDPTSDYSQLKECLVSQCVSSEDVARLYGTTVNRRLTTQEVGEMTPGLLYVLTQKPTCSSETQAYQPPGDAAVWGYSFLFVTLINLCSLLGATVLPCMNLKIYKVVLMFLVALAVGTLVGSGLLILIPEALGLTEEEDTIFLWKFTTVMGGVYLFFIVERVMRMINSKRENTEKKHEQDEAATQGTYISTFQLHAPASPQIRLKDPKNLPNNSFNNSGFVDDESRVPSSSDLKTDRAVVARNENGAGKAGSERAPEAPPTRVHVAPVAYMIIFGDALHNLIDGLSIGAAFTDSTLLGISVAVAVMCEELPHELGDFAILLNSGLTIRKALFYNFLSSLSCYLGLVIGILLGENTSANTWIFAVAGGMFLYISLADMLPEMNSSAESEDGKQFGEVKTFLVHNAGLLVGFGIMLLLAVYGGEINFTH